MTFIWSSKMSWCISICKYYFSFLFCFILA